MSGKEFGTVGDLLRENPQWPGEGVSRTVAPLELPHVEGMGEWPGEGIFFGMPEATYHSIFAFSASLCKDMIVSPMIAWAKSPLNPKREDDDGPFKLLGRAYHARICEGREAYADRFAVALDKADYPDALHTVEDIKRAMNALTATGLVLKHPVKSTARKSEWADALLFLDPTAQIWDQLVDDHADSIGTRDLIAADAHERIEIAARMIEADPQLCKAFVGGHAEVSLFWIDAETGVPCKARVDYFKMNAFLDLKSFSLKTERPVERAIDFEIASRKHFVAASHYADGIAAVKAIVRDDPDQRICFAAREFPEAVASVSAWARKWAGVTDDPAALYVFQATGVAPITRGRVLHRGTTWSVSHMAVKLQRRRFARCVEAFGADPWIDAAPIRETTDEDVPMSAVDFGDMSDE